MTEFAEIGPLYKFLETYQLEYDLIITWAKHVAAGMRYLHHEAPQVIIHRLGETLAEVFLRVQFLHLIDVMPSKPAE